MKSKIPFTFMLCLVVMAIVATKSTASPLLVFFTNKRIVFRWQ